MIKNMRFLLFLMSIFCEVVSAYSHDADVCLQQVIAISSEEIEPDHSKYYRVGKGTRKFLPINFFSCFKGAIRNVSIDDKNSLFKYEKEVIKGIHSVLDDAGLPKDAKYDRANREDDEIKKFWESANKIWSKVENKKVAFHLDYEDIRLFVFQGELDNRNVYLHMYTRIKGEGQIILLPFFESGVLLNIAEYWIARAPMVGNGLQPLDRSTLLNEDEKLGVTCENTHYCSLHRPIRFLPFGEDKFSKNWEEIKSTLSKGEDIKRYLDQDTLEWVENGGRSAVFEWIGSLNMIGYIEANPVFISFMKPLDEGVPKREDYNQGALLPVFFYSKMADEKLDIQLVGLGTVNTLANFFQDYQLD